MAVTELDTGHWTLSKYQCIVTIDTRDDIRALPAHRPAAQAAPLDRWYSSTPPPLPSPPCLTKDGYFSPGCREAASKVCYMWLEHGRYQGNPF